MTTLKELYHALTEEINRQIVPVYGFPVTLITSSSQGDFHWFYENVNGIFNEGTFDYVSARVSPDEETGTAQISPAGGFPNAYIQVITAIYYALSQEDATRLQRAVSSASAQATVVVRTYEGNFGGITDVQLREAQAALGQTAISNKQDYVIGYIMGYLWSSRKEENRPALPYTEMEAAPNLIQLLPLMPRPGRPVAEAAQDYLELLGPANDLEDQMFLGGWTIAQLRNNTAQPDAGNGGMKTVDPNTGAVSPDDQVGYGIGVSIPAIQRDLNDPSRLIRAVLEVSWSAEAPALLRMFLDEDSISELLKIEGTDERATITIEYSGYTMVPAGPARWREPANSGWFDGAPIADANRNSGRQVTGFHFTVFPSYNLGPLAAGGDFGLITHLLVSNTPVVTITHPQGNLEKAAFGGLKLKGLKLKGRSGRYYTVSSSPLEAGKGFRLVLTPADLAVTPLQQTAYVIGGAFDFPGISSPAS